MNYLFFQMLQSLTMESTSVLLIFDRMIKVSYNLIVPEFLCFLHSHLGHLSEAFVQSNLQ